MAFIKKGTRKAVYLWTEKLTERNSEEFDLEYGPKDHALYAGIYRCFVCGREMFHKGDSNLPPKDKQQDDHPHRWKLFISLNDPLDDAEVVDPEE